MKGLNTFTGIYSLIMSTLFLIAPIMTIGEAFSSKSRAASIDLYFRGFSLIMVVLGFILVAKANGSSTAGKVLVILAGIMVIMLSSIFGFIAGILGIIGGVLILASTKNIVVTNTNTEYENENIN